ncbi:glycosyltransferase [Cellulomonas sp. URHB0016]
MRIVLASHAVEGSYLRVGSHHYARELTLRGHEVLHVSTAWSPLQGVGGRADAERAAAARRGWWVDEHGTTHLVPRAAVPMRLGGGTAATCRRIEARGLGRPDVLVVDQPLFAPVARRLGARGLVYRPTDVHVGGLARRRERWLVEHADAVVATSGPVLESLDPVPAATPRVVVENGVEFARFCAPDEVARRAGIVYVGAVDERFDWELVTTVARAFPTVPTTIAGPVTRAPGPGLPPSVSVLDRVPYAEVQPVLARAQVGLIPLTGHARNAGRSPMKYYEYLASGLYVVASRTPSLAERATPGTWLYGSPEEAVHHVGEALDAPGANAAGRESARAQDWSAKAAQLLAVLEEVAGGRA